MSFNTVFHYKMHRKTRWILSCDVEMSKNYVDLGNLKLDFNFKNLYCDVCMRWFEVDDNVDDKWFKQVYGEKIGDF